MEHNEGRAPATTREQITEGDALTDVLLAGLHEAGWFARGDLDPDHLGGIIHDAVDVAERWFAARERALREEIADDILAELELQRRRVPGWPRDDTDVAHDCGIRCAARIARGGTVA